MMICGWGGDEENGCGLWKRSSFKWKWLEKSMEEWMVGKFCKFYFWKFKWMKEEKFEKRVKKEDIRLF